MKAPVSAFLILMAPLGGCAVSPTLANQVRTLPAGQYGGDQIGLTIAPDGSGQIELSCASAQFTGPATLDVGGHFLVKGTYGRGMGPVMLNPPPPLPATISGRLDQGGTLWLDIALRDSAPVRSAKLVRGAVPKLFRCL